MQLKIVKQSCIRGQPLCLQCLLRIFALMTPEMNQGAALPSLCEPILARSILGDYGKADPWFGIRYPMNLYRGCQHQCIYCDSRSACYGITDFSRIQIKTNATSLLYRELSRKRIRGMIGTGSMNDPYMPVESQTGLTREALSIICRFSFPVHIITKSDLVLRDAEIIGRISRVGALVTFSITTADDSLSKQIEPGATKVSERFRALGELRKAGIQAGIALMPVLPYVTDTKENIAGICDMASQAGAAYLLPAFGVTLRDRQKEYYFHKLKLLMPSAHAQTLKNYRNTYTFSSPVAAHLREELLRRCNKAGIATQIPASSATGNAQLSLFG